ncbi:MAG TPA: single-stranded DNA-binding protein [Pseudonocardiaceae bacterium]|jgi:single-strand DNA-binding protein|nr:single-stranded DNA-binding protein [Pseudonocardiaceae bacterium]
MENTVIGNLCADPTLRTARKSGRPIVRFTIAVNQRRRIGEEFVDRPPVFHRVVCFGQLAENASNTLHKGMEVLVVGEWVDDSYEDERGQKHAYIALEAKVVGPGLRWATAAVTKVERAGRVYALPDLTAVPVPPPDRGQPFEPGPPFGSSAEDQPGGFRPEGSPTGDPPAPAAAVTLVVAGEQTELDVPAPRTTRKGERRTARAG